MSAHEPLKRCKSCGTEKFLVDFYVVQNEYYSRRCKTCTLTTSKERYVEGRKRWKKNHPYVKGSSIGDFAKQRAKNPIKTYTTQLFNNARVRSEQRGWKFDLTREWIEERLNKGICAASNLPFIFNRPDGTKTKNPFAPSVDRKDNEKGYTKENCQIVMAWYNMAKADHQEDEILRLMASVVEHKKISSSRGN
jgi:hypothetical protein